MRIKVGLGSIAQIIDEVNGIQRHYCMEHIDISIVSSVPDSVVSMVCSIDFPMLNSLVWQDNSLTTVLYALSKHYRPLIERFDVRCFDNACD